MCVKAKINKTWRVRDVERLDYSTEKTWTLLISQIASSKLLGSIKYSLQVAATFPQLCCQIYTSRTGWGTVSPSKRNLSSPRFPSTTISFDSPLADRHIHHRG